MGDSFTPPAIQKRRLERSCGDEKLLLTPSDFDRVLALKPEKICANNHYWNPNPYVDRKGGNELPLYRGGFQRPCGGAFISGPELMVLKMQYGHVLLLFLPQNVH